MLSLLLSVALTANPAPKGLTLSGVVKDTAGKPVPQATVFVHMAKPRQSIGLLAPTGYPDCAKRAVADAQGRFALPDLAPDLVFSLLAVADGYAPAASAMPADPKAGPVSFTLKRHDLDKRDPALVLSGRVVDEEGKPVPDAVVRAFGYTKGSKGRMGNLDREGFDSLAVTSAKGEFRLGAPEPGFLLSVTLSARSLAPRKVHGLATGPAPHELKLFTGVEVTGRLVKGCKPLAGVAVGLTQKNWAARDFFGDFRAVTDAEGVFHVRNVPPEELFHLYGLMASLRGHGAVGVREVRTGPSRSAVAVGDVEVGPAHRLSGRVVLADGKPVPAGTPVYLRRDEARDYQEAVVDQAGRFTLAGLPAEVYQLSAWVPGYRLSAKNASLDALNPSQLLGAVRQDIDGLTLLLEPGPDPQRTQRADRLRESPLRGAPSKK